MSTISNQIPSKINQFLEFLKFDFVFNYALQKKKKLDKVILSMANLSTFQFILKFKNCCHFQNWKLKSCVDKFFNL